MDELLVSFNQLFGNTTKNLSNGCNADSIKKTC
jgi:hypothetical protein